ncbi:Leucine-rich repeat protein kinase family protein, putative [Theobroma cacao]|uniref:non-specific serine/threonine protein kinase n=1 Tax=Theobroma cacao TaxID=3641 RepID=A0A061GIV3_THECC|nr:Leucine-rich repeat protein kinase family protein, putative [Theobroma cacao]
MEMFKCFSLALFGGLAVVIQLQVLQVHGQDQSGFISLDCGLPRDSNYTETTTGLNYSSDASFIDTGLSRSILPEFRTNVQQQMWYVRSFPGGPRNCYNFRLQTGNKYLIRASFMYGNYDSQDKALAFDLHLGPNLWFSVRLENASTFINTEIIHVLSSNNLYVCLVNTGNGTPFISALELRHLMNSIYKTQTGSLDLFARLDIGSKDNETIRYKDDVYDRLWRPQSFTGWNQLRTSHTIDSDGHNDFQPPSAVMRTAATPKNASMPIDILLDADNSTAKFYVYMHFAEVKKLQDNEYRQFNISLNGQLWFGPFTPDYLSTTTIYTPSGLTGRQYQFSIYKADNSSLPPILNALEVYTVKELLQSQTDPMDVEAITNIKSMYRLSRNWQGDPCAPQDYLWDGLNCSYTGSGPPRIISLDLSDNSLMGPTPEFLSEMTSLRVLSLRGNMLNGSVPVELVERSKNGSLLLSQVAVKMFSSISVQSYKKFQAKVEPLLGIHHRNLTSLVGYCDEDTNKGLIYEYMSNGNFEHHLSESNTNILSWEQRLKIAMGAAQGLEQLHNGSKPPIIHRDVNPTNILLNEDLQAKLADFGLSRTFPVDDDTPVSTLIAGTPGYQDPEYIISNNLTEKSDVYSFGVVLLETITSRLFVMKSHETVHISDWVNSMLSNGDAKNIVDTRLQGDFDMNSLSKAIELALACVSPQSLARPAVNHAVME